MFCASHFWSAVSCQSMANEEHLKILRQGVEVWNQWRTENMPDPHGLADLRSANLCNAKLERACFDKADLYGADLSKADLSRATLRWANLRNANLGRANLSGSTLAEAGLGWADLHEADLRMADLSRADLIGAHLSSARLNGAKLSGTKLGRANLEKADLNDADFNGADLSDSNLGGANLKGAKLYSTNLTNATLQEADFNDAKLFSTIFADVDLSTTKGLERCVHHGPSSVGIDTIFLSGGRIPDTFLRGCGVPEAFITYVRSLVTNPIEFYSTFISYSSHDQAFAERLHADLQAKDFRCWFAAEDLKIGDRFQERIEESIKLFDKVMIVLSEASVKSRWVEREVNAAREREDREGRTVLFPIRIDDAVMNASQPWAADIRRSRHIGDFCEWEANTSYQKALQRLLRDLEAK